MATILASAAMVAPYGLGSCVPLSVSGKSRLGRRSSAATASAKPYFSPNLQSSNRPLLSVNAMFQDERKHSLHVARSWMEGVAETDLGKGLAPIAASAVFFLQDSAFAVEDVVEDVMEDVVKVADPPYDLVVVLGVAGVYLIIYLFVIPAIIYNYLRLRWYKRNALETFFQFMLVFIFYPGMLLLAPFINFRRLPRKGTEPP